MTDGGGPFRVRSLTASVYAPNLLFAIGQGAAIPMIALVALDLGASPAIAGVVVGLRGAGMMAFDVPAGVIVSRIGEKRAMVFASIVLTLVAAGMLMRPPLWLYAVLVASMGCTWSVWLLARVAFATGVTTSRFRGRVMSMIGGVNRIGLLVGPLLGSLLVSRVGITAPFGVLAALAAVASFTLARSKTPPFTPEPISESPPTLGGVFREHRGTLLTAGSVAVAAQILRSSREALIPLWGDQLGIGAGTIPLIFAAGAAVESLIFYPVGLVMDSRGRKSTAIPSIALMAVAVATIPLTNGLPALMGVALVMGLANGLGAGMNMTLGSDLSPPAGRSRFLGMWRLVSDAGNVSGPLVVAAVTSVATLGAAAVTVGTVGMVGVLVLWRLVPETLDPGG